LESTTHKFSFHFAKIFESKKSNNKIHQSRGEYAIFGWWALGNGINPKLESARDKNGKKDAKIIQFAGKETINPPPTKWPFQFFSIAFKKSHFWVYFFELKNGSAKYPPSAAVGNLFGSLSLRPARKLAHPPM
jgi:hypothetical protein